jgi:hypothetical protein
MLTPILIIFLIVSQPVKDFIFFHCQLVVHGLLVYCSKKERDLTIQLLAKYWLQLVEY